MNFTVGYETRDQIRAVAATADLRLKEVSVAADRLRSWAMIRGVPIAGPAFLKLGGSMTCRVCLPILAEVMPHPETELELDSSPAGEMARVHDVRFGEVRAVGRELQSALSSASPGDSLEFHSVDGDFIAGDVVLVPAKPPQSKPTTIALANGDANAAAAAIEQAPVLVRVVTIARQHGTAGEAIAASVARQLGLRLVDYDVTRRAAEEAGVSPDTVAWAAVHRGRFSRILDALARGGGGTMEGWIDPVLLRTSPLFTSAEYRSFIEDAIRDLAEQGDVLILGHGAQLVLADRADTFRVLVTGSIEKRAARAMAEGLAAGEARKIIREADQERVDYFHEFYGRGWLDASTYDLAINTDRTPVEDAAGVIIDAIQRRSVAYRSGPAAGGGTSDRPGRGAV